MKKLSVFLALAVLSTCIWMVPISINAEETAIDFLETDGTVGLFKMWDSANPIECKATNDAHGMAFYGATGTTAAANRIMDYTVSETGITSGQILLGADVNIGETTKPIFGIGLGTSSGTSYRIGWIGSSKIAALTRGDWSGWANLGGYDSFPKESAISTQVSENTWIRLDFVLDLTTKSRSLYIDGKHIQTVTQENDDTKYFTSIYDKEITTMKLVVQNQVGEENQNEGSGIYFDNVRFATLPSESTVKTELSGNDIYVWYGSGVKEDISGLSFDDVEIQYVADRSVKLNITEVIPVGQSGLKISTSGFDSKPEGEYQIVVNPSLHDIFENDVSRSCFYHSNVVNIEQINNGYEQGNTGITDPGCKFEIVEEDGNAANHVLKMVSSGGNGDTLAATGFNADTRAFIDTTYHYSLRVKKMSDDDCYWRLMPVFGRSEGQKEKVCSTMWFFRKDSTSKYSYLFNGANYYEDWLERERINMDWEAGKWYHVDIVWEYGDVNTTGTITYKIVNEETGASLYETTRLTPGMNTLKELTGENAVYFVGVRLLNSATTTTDEDGQDHSILVDDLKVVTTKNTNNVKTVRFIDAAGDEHIPDSTMPTDLKAVKITLNAPGGAAFDDIEGLVKLNGEVVTNGTWDGSTKTYTVDLNSGGILSPETLYTLTIDKMDNLGISAYSTSFTTEAGSFTINDIQIVDDSGNPVTLDDVTAGTNLKVVVTGINTTGNIQKATLSYGVYNDGMLTDFDFLPVEFATTGQTIQKELDIAPISSVEKLSVKGFVWDSMENMQPYLVPGEIK